MVFKKELKELLEKYDAYIYFSVGEGSDSQGLYDEKMCISLEGKEVITVSGYSLDSSDLT